MPKRQISARSSIRYHIPLASLPRFLENFQRSRPNFSPQTVGTIELLYVGSHFFLAEHRAGKQQAPFVTGHDAFGNRLVESDAMGFA
jgi:hypothetical protein